MRERLDSRWLSRGMKSSLLQGYGRYTQPWSMLRLNQLASTLTDIIDLSVGTSRGFDHPAPHVIEAVNRAIVDGAFDFPPKHLVTDLKRAISDNYEMRYELQVDSESEVCLTVGAAQAIDFTLRVLVNPGDEVLIIDPDYYPYEPHVSSFQAKVVPVPLIERRPGEWVFEFEELRKRVTTKTKLLMMSNANNPTGILYSRTDNEAIAELAAKKDFFILADHVSEEIVFDNAGINNIATIPDATERTIVCYSFSKAHNLSGFRIGYAIARREIVEHMNSLSEWTTDGVTTPGCVAAFAALTGPQDWIRKHVESLQERRDMMVNRLNKMPGVACGSPKGVYWAFPNIKAFGMPSHQLSEYLLTNARVRVKPGFWSGRNGEGHLRISFCVDPDWIQKGTDRIEQALRELHPN